MKQITILLSSALTLLLITSNNASYAYELKNVQFQGNKPNMNSGGRFMPKRNRLGDDLTGFGYKNILKKGNVFRGFSDGVDDFRGNVRILPNRNSGGGRFNPISKYSISDEPAFIPKPDAVGKAGFIGQAGIIDGTSNTVSPKGVQLEFINGKWVERDRSTGATRRRGDVVYDENGKDGFIVQADEVGFIGTAGKDGVLGGQEGEAFSLEINCIDGECKNKDHKYIGENGKAGIFVQDVGPEGKDGFIVQTGKDGALGPDVVTTLEHGPGLHDSYDTGTEVTVVDALQQPKGVPLKFINGEWVEDLIKMEAEPLNFWNDMQH